MTPESFRVFADEMIKSAALGRVWRGAKNILHEQWHGPNNELGWLGEGRVLRPGMSRGARVLENVKSLGGATRALPVGAKSMTMLGTLPMLPSALRKEDPYGRDRSRGERLLSLGGNIAGGMLGTGAVMRSRLGRAMGPFASSLVGGTVGSMIGEKTVSTPFGLMRHPAPVPQTQPQIAPSVGGQ